MDLSALKNARAELQANPRLRYLLYVAVLIAALYSLDALVNAVESSRSGARDAVERIEQLQALAARKGLLEEQNRLAQQYQAFRNRLFPADSDSMMKVHAQEWMAAFTKKFSIRSPRVTYFTPLVQETEAGELRTLPVLLESEHNPDDILSILHYIETYNYFLEVEEVKSLVKAIDLMSPKRFVLYLNFYYVLKQP